MDKLKYVGKRLNPALISLSGKPIDPEAFFAFEVKTFKELFRKQVIDIVRQSGSIFHPSIYENIAPQFGALESLLAVLEQNKCERVEITQASHERNEFLVRVQVRIPVEVTADDKLFTKADVSEGRNFVIVSFYLGLCKEFTLLSKKNELLENGMRDMIVPPGFLSAWSKSAEAPVSEKDSSDKAFDPNHVISKIIRHMRFEPRYNYTLEGDKHKERHFYHSPEGFLFRIEIDGYVTSSEAPPVCDGH